MRISSMHVRALADAVQNRGIPPTTLLAHAEIAPDRLAAHVTWFSLEEFDRLMVAAVGLAELPALGLYWGQSAPILQYDLLSILIAQAPSLRNAIDSMLRFQAIFADRPEIEFSDKQGRALFRCLPLACSELGLRVRTEVLVTALVRLLRDLGGSARTEVKRLSFPYARPAYGSEYDRLFGEISRFGEPECRVEFEYAALDAHNADGNAELHGVLESQAERVLSRIVEDGTYRERVRRYLERVRPRVPEMQETARALALSERSLRRRLADEQVSYASLVDTYQAEEALGLLDDPTKSIKEVAFALGFANVSGFHRAFKRWTGKSPSEVRAERAR